MHTRRITRGRGLAIALAAALALASLPALAGPPEVRVYRSPQCGCCTKWMDHLREHGFRVTEDEVADVGRVKRENGIPDPLASCHTAFVEGYFVEGHVPAEDVARLLEERPPVAGLAVPGMPVGSPGMEGPHSQTYRVYAVDPEGGLHLFSTHRP